MENKKKLPQKEKTSPGKIEKGVGFIPLPQKPPRKPSPAPKNNGKKQR